MQFVLASESARRVDLLHKAGYDFQARRSDFPEVTLPDPRETVEANARGKALTVAATTDHVVLAADTIVYLPALPEDRRVMGQARDEDEVRRMLRLLQGQTHEVYSGVAVAREERTVVRNSLTTVRMREVGEDEALAYARYGEGIGKAGGYAIQGRAAIFVEWIGGDYSNVVGLPLALTRRMLADFGVLQF